MYWTYTCFGDLLASKISNNYVSNALNKMFSMPELHNNVATFNFKMAVGLSFEGHVPKQHQWKAFQFADRSIDAACTQL